MQVGGSKGRRLRGVAGVFMIGALILLSACADSESPKASAQVTDTTSADAVAEPVRKKVRVGAPNAHLPPFFIVTDRTGLERDIIERAFRNAGYEPEFIYMRGRERAFMAKKNDLDCITTVSQDSDRVEAHFSDVVITYQDAVITLEGSGRKIGALSDLYGLTIEAFPDAAEVLRLGNLPRMSRYHEHSSKGAQVILLYRGKIDALIMESSFFDYFRNEVRRVVDVSQPVTKSWLFPDAPYRIVCHEAEVRDAFNQGLVKLLQSEDKQTLEEYYFGTE